MSSQMLISSSIAPNNSSVIFQEKETKSSVLLLKTKCIHFSLEFMQNFRVKPISYAN